MDTPDPRPTARDAGVASVEYGLLVSLVAGAVLVAVTALGGAVSDGFTTTCRALSGKPIAAAPSGVAVGVSTAPGQSKKKSSC